MNLRIEGLVKQYDGRRVLDGFSAEFPEGKTTAILAPSGAGKTTLLRILCGLEKPDAGAIRGMEGRRLSVVFQEDRLLPDSDAVSNIRLAAPASEEKECRQLLSALRIPEWEQRGKPVREFSGGMRRRTAIARALAVPADFYLFDEPFRGLDEETKSCVIACVREKTRGKTVLLVTHDEREAAEMGAVREIDIAAGQAAQMPQ